MRSSLENLPAGVDKTLVARVLDCCEIASERQVIKYTDFLDPFHRDFVRPLVSNYFGLRYLEEGGYPGAEKQRLVIYPDYYRPGDIEVPITVIQISLSDPSRLLSHRDYLGAIVGLGLKRSVVGDILAFEGGAQVIVAGEIANAVLGIGEVNKFKAEAAEIPPYQIKVEDQPVRTITSTVASVRLDAVLSSGLGIGRSKAAELIKGDKVKVNWRQIGQPAFQLSQGDVLSVRGKGRLELEEVGAETKKGRVRISLKKFS
jgi:RNA-binding protein YlmH